MTLWGTHESRAGEKTGVGMAGRSETRKATSGVADKAGAEGRHGARSRVRERVFGRREKPTGKSSGVGGEEGGRGGYRVAENPGGGCHGVRGAVELPQGIDTPGVDKFPRRDKNSGVATNG